MYTLETHHWIVNAQGLNVHSTQIQEFDNFESAQQAIFLYKLADNIGYTVYECTIDKLQQNKNLHKTIVEQWFDKGAYRG